MSQWVLWWFLYIWSSLSGSASSAMPFIYSNLLDVRRIEFYKNINCINICFYLFFFLYLYSTRRYSKGEGRGLEGGGLARCRLVSFSCIRAGLRVHGAWPFWQQGRRRDPWCLVQPPDSWKGHSLSWKPVQEPSLWEWHGSHHCRHCRDSILPSCR